jgi:secreted PhoX family phosphatase
MGRFRREAVAIDPRTSIVYQSEDLGDGLLYRFLPEKPGRDGDRGDLSAGGRLQALRLLDRQSADTRNWFEDGKPIAPNVPVGQPLAVQWVDLADVQSPLDDLRYRGRWCSGAACFARTEGMWFAGDVVYFACTSGGKARKGQIWRYTPSPLEGTTDEQKAPARLELFLEPNDKTVVNNADNLTVAPWGDLIVCEDSEETNRLIGVTPAGQTYVLARNVRDKSEFAGAVFAPDGRTLFVNLQECALTLAITGPWQQRT